MKNRLESLFRDKRRGRRWRIVRKRKSKTRKARRESEIKEIMNKSNEKGRHQR